MKQATPAIYENGVFRPLGKIDLAEHSKVELSFETPKAGGESRKRLPKSLENLLGTMPEGEGREMMEAIEEAFEKVDPNEWK